VSIPFVTLDDPAYGSVVEIAPGVQRVTAHNPSKFTYHGTGTYIIGADDVVVIDPGPRLDSHRDALAIALNGRRVRAILITHCHADHSPLAAWLRAERGAPTVAFGPHGAVADDLPVDDFSDVPGADDPDPAVDGTVEETVDLDFVPDVVVADGDEAACVAGATFRAVHTPGHTSNHLCFELVEQRTLFTGDHIMGWSTTVVAPPDGDMRAYVDSLRKVAARRDAVLMPTHGAPVADPQPFVAALVQHRLDREAQVVAAVRAGTSSVRDMVVALYTDVRPQLYKAAARSVRAHLAKLCVDGAVVEHDDRFLPA
jgi:glyoxylase-like metal-dependent hydrolase (beta-lactamase superfamily II)